MYIGYILAPLSSVFTYLFTRKQSDKQLEKLKEEVSTLQKTNTGVDIANIKASTDILIINVVKPLERELQGVRRELNMFRKAVSSIKSCQYEDDCPVKEHLYKSQDNDNKNVD